MFVAPDARLMGYLSNLWMHVPLACMSMKCEHNMFDGNVTYGSLASTIQRKWEARATMEGGLKYPRRISIFSTPVTRIPGVHLNSIHEYFSRSVLCISY